MDALQQIAPLLSGRYWWVLIVTLLALGPPNLPLAAPSALTIAHAVTRPPVVRPSNTPDRISTSSRSRLDEVTSP